MRTLRAVRKLLSCVMLFLDGYDCGANWFGYDGHCYKYINSGYNWNQAKYYCLNQGGHLVEIESEGEQRFVECK